MRVPMLCWALLVAIGGIGCGDTEASDQSCTTGADCASGKCFGEGCGAGEGRCMPPEDACAASVLYVCSCDGQTINWGCDVRWAHEGACMTDEAAPVENQGSTLE